MLSRHGVSATSIPEVHLRLATPSELVASIGLGDCAKTRASTTFALAFRGASTEAPDAEKRSILAPVRPRISAERVTPRARAAP